MANLDSTPRQYDRVTVSLHWLTAAMILLQWASASLIFLERERPVRMIYWTVHFGFGLALFAVIAARLWWRTTRGLVLPPLGEGLAERVARAVHGLLYALVLWLIGLGIVIILLRGWPLAGLFTIAPIVAGYKPLSSTLIEVHKWSAHLLMAVAFGHAFVALFHQFVLKDGALLRMARATARI